MSDHAIRYLPELPLPPYSYVPGQAAHPKSHPDGHGCPGPQLTASCHTFPAEWSSCELYLWGFDLFNAGYYWEAHEAWEEVWIAAGRKGVAADFLKSLIKLAAAGVKAREGQAAGVRRHAQRAQQLATSVAEQTQQGNYAGCELRSLRELAGTVAEAAERLAAADSKVSVLPTPIRLQWPSC